MLFQHVQNRRCSGPAVGVTAAKEPLFDFLGTYFNHPLQLLPDLATLTGPYNNFEVVDAYQWQGSAFECPEHLRPCFVEWLQ